MRSRVADRLPTDRSGRCTSTTSSACCSARPIDRARRPADRPGRHERGVDGYRPRRLPERRRSAAAAARLRLGHRLRRRPDGRPRFGRCIRPRDRGSRSSHKTVYIPAGTFQVNRHIVVDDVTIEGAGSWWSIVKGHAGHAPSAVAGRLVHTGVGFYGKYAADGGSTNVHLSDFAIEGDVRERIDTDQVNGIGGALSDSTIDGLYIHHTKVGIWLDGPMNNVTIANTVIADQIADGINFHQGVTNSKVVNSLIRNTADDALAMWSQAGAEIENADNVFDHNTVQTPRSRTGSPSTAAATTPCRTTSSPTRCAKAAACTPAQRFGSTPFAGHLGSRQHDGSGRHLRAQLEHRPRRDLALRAGGLDRRRRRGDRRRLPPEHLQRDHARVRLPGEGSVLDLERPLQGHPRRRHGHLGGERPRRPARRRSRTSTHAMSAPSG